MSVAPSSTITEQVQSVDLDGPAARWRWLLLPAFLAALPALAMAIVELAHIGSPSEPVGDLALLARDADRALHGELLLGPYSRFGWNHPGPALSYWLAPFWWASGHHYGGLGMGAAVLSALMLALIVLAVGRTVGRRAAWATSAVLVCFCWTYGVGRLREPWNPAAVILPLVVVAVAGAAAAAGRRWWLTWCAVAATLALQAHVGSAPVLGGFVTVTALVGLLGHLRSGRAIQRWWAPSLVTLALLGVMWMPPLAQQVFDGKGNMSELTRFITESPTPHHTWTSIWGPAERLAPLTVPGYGTLIGGTGPGPGQPRLFDRAVLVMLGAGLVVGTARAIVRRLRFGGALAAAGLVGAPLAIVAAYRIQYVIYPYLLFSVVSVGLVAWVSLAVTVSGLAEGPLDRPTPKHRHGRRSASWRVKARAAALPGLVVMASVAIAVSAAGTTPSGPLRNDPEVGRLSERIRSLPHGRTPQVMVQFDQDHWPLGAGIVRDLEAHGYRTSVPVPWRYMFGSQARVTGHEQIRFVVTSSGARHPPARDTDLLVTSDHGVSLYVGPP